MFFGFLILFSGSHGLMVVIQTLVYALDSGVYVFLVYDLVGSFIINVRNFWDLYLMVLKYCPMFVSSCILNSQLIKKS